MSRFSTADSIQGKIPQQDDEHNLSFNSDSTYNAVLNHPSKTKLENQNEIDFRTGLDQLIDVIADNSSSTMERAQKLLSIGASHFGLSNGLVASAMGDSLEVISAVGEFTSKVQAGDTFPIDDTICADVLNTDNVIAFNDIQLNSAHKHCTGLGLDLKSFIGTQVLTQHGPLGLVAFCSNEATSKKFTKQDHKLIGLIANWLGTLLGNEEQLEFLSSQNDYYQSLFQCVPTMLMLCNQDGLVLSASNRLSNVLGVDSISLPGQNCQNFFISADKQAVNNAVCSGDVEHVPLSIECKNGDTLEVELNSSIRHIGSMQGVRMIVLADVSERNKAIKEAEEQNRQLALNNESLNQFAYVASHDLQEPLRKIQQFSHFLEEDLGDVMNSDAKYHIGVIVKSAERMGTLIKDLLEFSGTAKGDLNLVTIDLNQLLEEVCNEFELSIEESNSEIRLNDLPTIQGDHRFVRQLFTNLVSNSLKYRDASRTPIIEITAVVNQGQSSVTVTDNGIGFEQSQASKVFQPFNRLHKDKKYVGNGIGLSICSTVCEKHNWDLSVTSEPGKGSAFTILFNGQLQ